MKNVFDIILMIWLSLTVLFCMFLFNEEVYVRQQTIHLRNKTNEIIEINSGYTSDAELEIKSLLSKIKYRSEIKVSKPGKLSYGEKINYTIILYHTRKLPFSKQPQNVEYSINGEFYNATY